MYVVFEKKYDHTWPSRAVSAYPAGWRGRVKKEVGERAVKVGAARKVTAEEAAELNIEQEETLPGNLPADLAEPDALLPNRHVADGEDSQ